MSVSATLLICDDIRFENTGKMLIVGGYTSDIAIPQADFNVGQLLFLFSLDAPISDFPREVKFEVVFPGDELRENAVVLPPLENLEGRTRWYLRQILNFNNQALRPGRIFARVVCDGQETLVGAPWIVLVPPIEEPVVTATP